MAAPLGVLYVCDCCKAKAKGYHGPPDDWEDAPYCPCTVLCPKCVVDRPCFILDCPWDLVVCKTHGESYVECGRCSKPVCVGHSSRCYGCWNRVCAECEEPKMKNGCKHCFKPMRHKRKRGKDSQKPAAKKPKLREASIEKLLGITE